MTFRRGILMLGLLSAGLAVWPAGAGAAAKDFHFPVVRVDARYASRVRA